ncbi:VOC family protein [Propionibacteriaceae bacterium Y2011]
MAAKLNPYLNYDGHAREAMEFYQSVLGGDLKVSTFGEFGGGEGVDPEGVMHAQLSTPSGITLMASDLPPGMPFEKGSQITISLSGGLEDAEQLRDWFAKLSEGGEVTMKLEKQVWGDEYGAFTDKFGISWMVDFATEESAAADG